MSALQIDLPPAHDAVFLEIGTGFDDIFQLVQLFGAQTPHRPRRFAIDQPVWALRIEAVDTIPQGLLIHPPDPRGIATAHAVAHRRKRQKSPTLVGIGTLRRELAQIVGGEIGAKGNSGGNQKLLCHPRNQVVGGAQEIPEISNEADADAFGITPRN